MGPPREGRCAGQEAGGGDKVRAAVPHMFHVRGGQTMREKGLGEVIYYPHAAHGWTLRGDLSKPEIMDAVNDAYKRAVLFFAVKVPRA